MDIWQPPSLCHVHMVYEWPLNEPKNKDNFRGTNLEKKLPISKGIRKYSNIMMTSKSSIT